MSFAERIDKYLRKKQVIEIGEVKNHQAYLYSVSNKYEIVLNAFVKKKTLSLEIRNNKTKEIILSKKGTLNNLLSIATGYVLNN
jgi:hypothetical protein